MFKSEQSRGPSFEILTFTFLEVLFFCDACRLLSDFGCCFLGIEFGFKTALLSLYIILDLKNSKKMVILIIIYHFFNEIKWFFRVSKLSYWLIGLENLCLWNVLVSVSIAVRSSKCTCIKLCTIDFKVIIILSNISILLSWYPKI